MSFLDIFGYWQVRIIVAFGITFLRYWHDVKTAVKEKSFKNVDGWEL